MIEPFRIVIGEDVLLDLWERIAKARIPDGISAYGWEQGTEPGYLRGLMEYWGNGYDWREQEDQLNRFDQFMGNAGGQPLHFIHIRASDPRSKPLLLLHGWPGSIYEFHKLIPLLNHPQLDGGEGRESFHLVVPSLPGYGFSPAPKEPGASPRQMGKWIAALMREELGYSRYYVQGGDWGSVIGSWIAFDCPEEVAGLHLNMAGLRPRIGEGSPPLSDEEKAFLARAKEKRREEFAYQAIQGTRPQSLGVGLNDSPAGLAAWVVEKFRAWSDCGGVLENSFTRDEIITNLMLYWVTGSITSSMRLYYEYRKAEPSLPPNQRVETPTAFSNFPREILNPPRSWVERAYNLVKWTDMPRGGHFAALEEPELLAEDIHAAFLGMPI